MTSPIISSNARDQSVHWDSELDETDIENESAANRATPAVPATPAIPATPADGEGTSAIRATPATPATPAIPVSNDLSEGTEPVGLEAESDVEVAKVSRRRSGLRRAESANGQMNFGQITSAQWALVHDFKNGLITADDLRNQFIAAEKSKLDTMVQESKISSDEESRRLARFSTLVDKLINNFS